jgi:Septum formation
VFATFALPASAWPGTAAVQKEASSGCASRLTGYLNPQLAISLAQSYVFPNKVAWTAGTRTVICEVQAVSGQLTQSVRGASLRVISSCHVLPDGGGHYAGCPLWTTDFTRMTPFA